ncbi:sigma-70 family RNA polymerase sigma factor [Streptomyces sp. NA04227]|uniref:sigma-70 family RNA polymerase sigma factor n=1 Tax=Streptomyces sp. NA04227 TaxID=2742136 RepID=UPI001591FFFC|nr:sigma-70 family RNA polymerase sigma factor [Streptomyces sp. NA04227]QKW06543.1 sigma-70 family RNA polymerase sigma factor [Streptomyces sp. NA04227]
MNKGDWPTLAEEFEAHRSHLRAVAYRMLGSAAEAEDAVQESWLRLGRADTTDVENLGGWLTTVVGRICLDMLRSRTARREELLGGPLPEPDPHTGGAGDLPQDPVREAELADSVGRAMLIVLDTLTPAERLAFVLHDMFAVPFGEVATIIGKSPAAVRQLASRARRRVQTADTSPDSDLPRQHAVVSAFLAAARDGRFGDLLTLLDPEVVLRADPVAVPPGALAEVVGAEAVAGRARMFADRAQGSQLALVDGRMGMMAPAYGALTPVGAFEVRGGRITRIDIIADPARLAALDLALLPA